MVKPDSSSEARSEATRAPESDRPEGGAPEGVLSDLIEVEAQVKRAVREAQAEAERRVAAARSEIVARAQEQDHALEASLRDLREVLETERSAALAEIQRRSDEQVGRYLDADQARVDALAGFVARRVAEDDLEADGPEP